MEEKIQIDVEAAVERRKHELQQQFDERVRNEALRATRRAENLRAKLDSVEKATRKEAERLSRILSGEASPYLVRDWLLLDTWSPANAALLLVGLEPITPEVRESRKAWLLPGDPEIAAMRTLRGLALYMDYSDLLPDWQAIRRSILSDRSSAIRRIQRIWDSGQHPDRPTPAYFIEWAQRKGLVIPWMEWAIEQNLVGTRPDARPTEGQLGERERTTLLTIIAALSKEAKIDLEAPSKAAGQIELLVEKIGARVAKRTIEEHVKRVRLALEKRAIS
ncbi:hypothetical protein [Cupriavidus gilardii]|uniref:hypothetical protein n=1 Tax=Cupriavidus gilardii TaxID=82541 RepID=UPI0021B25695|nr:hypothetical protein [Cupriavidus gilardii]UXC37332.1 hypothetical protein N4G38_07815 [Cupriavidus gilardii]